MPTCRRSATRRIIALAGCLWAGLATAQGPGESRPGMPSSQEGRAALDALREALSRRDATALGLPDMTVTPPAPDPATQKRAWSAMHRQTGAPAMRDRVEADLARTKPGILTAEDAMASRVAQAVGLAAPDAVAIARVAAPDAQIRWTPLLFVSSSMPIDELRTYAHQLEKAGGTLAFRGMPGGLQRIAPMARLSAEILRIDPGCEGPACAMRAVPIVVDPIAFREHGIARVPALVMVPGDPTRAYCERGDSTEPLGPIAYGDAALSGLLEELAHLGGKEEVRDAEARLGSR